MIGTIISLKPTRRLNIVDLRGWSGGGGGRLAVRVRDVSWMDRVWVRDVVHVVENMLQGDLRTLKLVLDALYFCVVGSGSKVLDQLLDSVLFRLDQSRLTSVVFRCRLGDRLISLLHQIVTLGRKVVFQVATMTRRSADRAYEICDDIKCRLVV